MRRWNEDRPPVAGQANGDADTRVSGLRRTGPVDADETVERRDQATGTAKASAISPDDRTETPICDSSSSPLS